MRKYSEIPQPIRRRFIQIRGPLIAAFFVEYTKGAVREFDALLETGPVCLINHDGLLFSVPLPTNIDLSKIPQTTCVKL